MEDRPTNQSLIHKLESAIAEIQSLRRRNEILSAKVEMIDLFGVVLHTSPNYASQGMGEDIAWALEREIEKLKTTGSA